MEEFFIKNGDFIDYEILPIHRNIQLSIIKGKEKFDSLLKEYKGERLIVNNEDMRSDFNFVKTFIFYDFNNKAKFYKLQNGYIAVDQSDLDKGNPYFLCTSTDVHKLVRMYLSIFYVDDWIKPIVKCSLNEYLDIKKFLEAENLRFIQEKSDHAFKMYSNNNGQIIYIRYDSNYLESSKHQNIKKSTTGINKKNPENYYNYLAIYESMEIMDLLGEF